MSILVAIAGGGKPSVLLEVATEEGLIGEVHPVGDLLYIQSTVFELMLDLCDRMMVDDRLGTLAAHALGDVREVAWGNVQCLGIEGYLPFCGAMAQH